MGKKAIVVGAGIGGISIALRLRKKGYEVHVFEKNAYPGGKLSEITSEGFRFDAGPSLLTMPYLIDDLFRLYDRDPKVYFKYDTLNIACNYFFSDQTELSAYADRAKFIQEFTSKTGIAPRTLRRFLARSKYIWDVTNPLFLKKSLHRLSTYLRIDTLIRAFQLPYLGIGRNMARSNHSNLSNTKAEQYFNRYATYNGSNPYKAPATLNVISYLEHFEGAYYPKDGMISITQSLIKLAKEEGVQFHFEQSVSEILVKNKRATGIKTKQEEIQGDIVISNADIHPTYMHLLPNHSIPKRIKNQERSSSAFIFYWGINAQFNQLEAHNILFSSDYEQEFREIWNEKRIPKDPTVYINISSKYNESDAPIGCENWFVMINVPSNVNMNWEQSKDEIRARVIQIINNRLNTDIEKHIATENVLTPKDIEMKSGSFSGSLYGSASNDVMAAFFRQSNQLKIAKNLYAVGGSVHPGGGIPLCLLSAKITSEMIPEA